jgi:hypothetical protein
MLYELKEYVGLLLECRGESGWCSDVTSTHGAWRHAGVRFPLSGDKTPEVSRGAWFRSTDLWVMSPTRQPLRHSAVGVTGPCSPAASISTQAAMGQ